jgi:hypothetical protein
MRHSHTVVLCITTSNSLVEVMILSSEDNMPYLSKQLLLFYKNLHLNTGCVSYKRNSSCVVWWLHKMKQPLTSPSRVKAREWWLPHATSITSLPDKLAPTTVGNKHWVDEPFPSSEYPLWPQEYTSPVSVKAITCGPLPYAKPEIWIHGYNCCIWVSVIQYIPVAS